MTLTTESVTLPEAWLNVPLLRPPVGLNADKEQDALKEKFPKYIPGKQRIVEADLEDAFCLLLAAATHFDEQKKLVKNWMRRTLGNAEFAISSRDGTEVASRRLIPKEGYTVPPRIDDSIYKARGR